MSTNDGLKEEFARQEKERQAHADTLREGYERGRQDNDSVSKQQAEFRGGRKPGGCLIALLVLSSLFGSLAALAVAAMF